jgi:hypothetical protein
MRATLARSTAGWVAALIMAAAGFPPRPWRYRRRHGVPGWRPKWWPWRRDRTAGHVGATTDWSPAAEVAAVASTVEGLTLDDVLDEVAVLLDHRLPLVRLEPATTRAALRAFRPRLDAMLRARTLRPTQPRAGRWPAQALAGVR